MTHAPVEPAVADAPAWGHVKSVACWHCGAQTAPGLFCGGCDAILPLSDQADYFAVFGLPRKLQLDTADLQRRYYALHRRLHPDRYQTGPQTARDASLGNTATLNRAYRTLKDPVDRGLYWLGLHGERLGADNNRVPRDLAMLVFEVQERLEELRAVRGTTAAAALARTLGDERDELVNRRTALLARLADNFARWDAATADPPTLMRELKTTLSDLAYLGTLIRDVNKELDA